MQRSDPDVTLASQVDQLLAEVKEAAENQLFVQALGAFREAANLSRGFESLQEAAFETALKQAAELAPQNWRVASALLSEASRLIPGRVVPTRISLAVESAAFRESIANEKREKENAADNAGQIAAALAQLRALLDNGPLAEAEQACKQAAARFPQSDELRELASEIEKKETAIRHLIESGEDSLRERDFEAAGEFFAAACHLLPLDRELADHLVGILHQHAQTVLENDWQAAERSLDLAARIQPGCLISPVLTAALQEKRQEEKRQEDQRQRDTKLRSLRTRAAIVFVTVAALLGISFFAWKNFPARIAKHAKAPIEIAPASQSEIGTLTIRTNVPDAELYIDDQKYAGLPGAGPLQIKLSPDTYKIRAVHPGYTDYGPVTVAVTKGGETALDLQLDPKPAMLKIRGAEPGTQVKVDGVLVGAVTAGPPLTGQLSPGRHVIELSREGFLPKKIALQLAPGEATLLSGSNVQLQSSDASLRLPEPPSPDAAQPDKKESGAYADVAPAAPVQEQPQTPGLPSLAQTGQGEWDALDKNSKPALAAFAVKYPASPHAAEATGRIADLDRQAAALESQRAEEAARHRAEAEQALAESVAAESLRAESAAIVALIGRFANAWSAKDMDAILTIERDLDRRALKSQLLPVKAIAMRISALSAPQISGTQATIVCRRQADETFSDGSIKQNPESVITYVLSKRNGVWGIDGTH